MPPKTLGNVSFWYAGTGLPEKRPCLASDTSAAVAIIGAGYTGLWTAYYLKKAQPDLDVIILEKEFAGFGASGRNGGWAMGTFAWNHQTYAKTSSRAAVLDMVRHLEDAVPELIRVCAAEGIEADILPTQELLLAHLPAHLERLHAEIALMKTWGAGHRVRLLSAAEASARLHAPGLLGGVAISGMARLQPAKLVRGLAEVVERMGVRIVETTEVLDYSPGQVITAKGIVTAPIVLRCTEGYTATLPGHRRDWLPLNSAQIATVPLPSEVWQQIGWQGYDLVSDVNNRFCYCQRTADDRITIGARGTPYRYGSRIDGTGVPDAATLRDLTEILRRYFPQAANFAIDHAWSGVLAVPRDWCASITFDAATGIGAAGGYVGCGVSTSNLAGRTLAELALGLQTPRTGLPWVNHRVRKWEFEPVRWLAIQLMYRLFTLADRREARPGASPSSSRLSRLASWIAGQG